MFGYLKKLMTKKDANKIKVIFVCMGNICRSPTAHGVFQALVDKHRLRDFIEVESAGTHSYHIGSPPDLRSQAVAKKNNIDLSRLKARRFIQEDFQNFHYIIGMDEDNIANMRSIAPEEHDAVVSLMLEYSDKYDRKEIPDPYFGNDGFELVFDMIENSSKGLLEHIRGKHNI